MPDRSNTLARLRSGALAGATRLDLSACGLTTVPPEVWRLADTLEVLDVSGNLLQDLPEDLPRLHQLKVLFASANPFTELPAVLGRCPALEMIGFKACRLRDVPEEALPPTLRWLTLTDNRIEELPDSLDRCPRLQKLMLAGNRLRQLPPSLAQCHQLELIRLAANAFASVADALPESLLALPRLAWLAHGGNPYSRELEGRAQSSHRTARIQWSELQLHEQLGEGASGVIHAASWRVGSETMDQRPGSEAEPQEPPQAQWPAVALKLFKGTVTSDGLPETELSACIAAGEHPHLVEVLGQLVGHPQACAGLVLQRIPSGFRTLADPPSLASCTRDVYATGRRLSASVALNIAKGMQSVLSHLHERGLTHGDLYAHNILVDAEGHALLGDFGAASFVPVGDPLRRAALQRIDRRALAVLLLELAGLCSEAESARALREKARQAMA